MSPQLVVSIDNDSDYFRWCWLQDGRIQSTASGDFNALIVILGNVAQQAWLLLPGAKVISRQLEYTEKEKKHLRNLLPFQLEESIVGDVDNLHVAIGVAAAGQVTFAYTDKPWLKAIFTRFANSGIEFTRCWSRASILPLQLLGGEPIEPSLSSVDTLLEAEPLNVLTATQIARWVLAVDNGQVDIRFAEQQSFSVPFTMLNRALDLLIEKENCTTNLPSLYLRAAQQNELELLVNNLPEHLKARVESQTIVEPWLLDFNGKAIDLCQAEFSQRLPLERWAKLWRGVGILALITFVVYVGVLGFNIYKLSKQNLQLRQQMEAVYRTVAPNGQADDPEKRLRLKVHQLEPKAQSGSVVQVLADLLPLIVSHTDVVVKVISYSADTNEMTVNVQAHTFNSIDALRQSISAQGYGAELQGVNVQGDLNTGRLKISKLQH